MSVSITVAFIHISIEEYYLSFTYRFKKSPNILELGCQGDALPFGNWKLRAGIVQQAVRVFKSSFEFLKSQNYVQYYSLYLRKKLNKTVVIKENNYNTFCILSIDRKTNQINW